MKVQIKKQRGGKRPGAGRPKGSRNVLPRGTCKTLKTFSGLPPEAMDDPVVADGLKFLEAILKGEHKKERYLQSRIGALDKYIELKYGKAKQRTEVSPADDVVKWIEEVSTEEDG